MADALIGITSDRSLNPSGYPQLEIPEAYSQAITEAGGAPVLIPCGLPSRQLLELLNHLDGIVFSGGGDVEPARYGSSGHPRVSSVDPDRDRVEIELFRQAIQLKTPFLGICRGLQLLNVALGGTLYDDLADQFTAKIHHDQYNLQPRDALVHPVKLIGGSCLRDLIGSDEIQVNSLHHQGIRQLAGAWQASAYAPDELVEGIEIPGYPFGVAVQWHPECLLNRSESQNLFQGFVKAAARYRQK